MENCGHLKQDMMQIKSYSIICISLFHPHAQLTFAVGESVESGFALRASPADNVVFAVALTPIFFTLEGFRSVDVAFARTGAVVVFGRYGESRVLAETTAFRSVKNWRREDF